MEQQQETALFKKQQKKYTILLQEHGRAIQEYSKVEAEVDQLDKERR
jgi:hypothetical protein